MVVQVIEHIMSALIRLRSWSQPKQTRLRLTSWAEPALEWSGCAYACPVLSCVVLSCPVLEPDHMPEERTALERRDFK